MLIHPCYSIYPCCALRRALQTWSVIVVFLVDTLCSVDLMKYLVACIFSTRLLLRYMILTLWQNLECISSCVSVPARYAIFALSILKNNFIFSFKRRTKSPTINVISLSIYLYLVNNMGSDVVVVGTVIKLSDIIS